MVTICTVIRRTLYFYKESFVFQFMRYRKCVDCAQNASIVISSLVVLTVLTNGLCKKQGLEFRDSCIRWTDWLFEKDCIGPALNILSHSVLVLPHFLKHEIHLHILKKKKWGVGDEEETAIFSVQAYLHNQGKTLHFKNALNTYLHERMQ